jgi:exodeoxyribonuclease III
MKLERLAYRLETANPRLQAYLQELRARKPVVLAGDLNVAHLDIDCYNFGAKHLPKVPGCTLQEREAHTAWLAEHGLVDAFRLLHPSAKGAYTYWNVKTGARAVNRGLRLDYFIVPAEDVNGARGVVRVHDCTLLHEATTLSDHCPISLTLELLDN